MDDKTPYQAGGGFTTEKVESDSAGRFQKPQTHSLRLYLPDGVHAMQYGSGIGWPWMNPGATSIEIPASGMVRQADGWVSGEWIVVIRGKRLASIFDHIAEARRLSVRLTGEVDGDKPVIESVTLVAYETP